MRLLLPAVAAVALTAVAAISMARGHDIKAGGIVVTSAWARATPPGATVGAAYVTLRNGGGADDRLLGAASPAAKSVAPHGTIEENGVAAMRPLGDLAVPAGGTLEMQPGATHLMLMGLAEPLQEGDSVPLTLVFEKAGAVTIPLEVAPIGADGLSHQH
jgi:periplasmic copper chaperone A